MLSILFVKKKKIDFNPPSEQLVNDVKVVPNVSHPSQSEGARI